MWRPSRKEEKVQKVHNCLIKPYNKRVTHRPLFVGDLVLKTPDIQKGLSASMFFPKWEEPYIIKKLTIIAIFIFSEQGSEDRLLLMPNS